MSKKSMILMIVTVLCIIATVVLRGVVDKADAEYTEVEVRVVSSDTVYRKILGKRQMCIRDRRGRCPERWLL